MQNDDQNDNTARNTEIKTVEIDQDSQTSAMTGPSLIENPQVPTSQSTFGLDVSCSDDDEVSEVDSFILDTEDPDPVLEPSFLLPQSMEGATVTVDPETHARLEALLEAAGIGKLSTADGKALTDPEVLRKLTSSVSCALDEAAQALHRMRAEQQQQSQLGNIDSHRSLAEACSDGDVPTVRKLLREGGSVHETTEEGDSLLSLACSAGYYELAQVLLAMKANVEDRGIKGDCTPLMEAASGGYVDIVKLLIAHGADVNAQSSAGNTPLHYAACGGYEDVVQVLIDAGANVEQHNENGHTPLMEAASAGHVGVAAILLHSGAGINTHSNEFKESALTLACYKGHLEMVKFLLEAGADQEHKTDEMHTALMEASMDGHVEVARLLLDSGAQVNMPADSFESPLTLAACGGHVELANLLIERGANLEEVNDEGYTPLMEAAREGHEEMVALLLAHDADINAQTEETQETALTLACCGGFLDVADFLISAGADIELGCSTPLMEAAQEGHLELVKYLLKDHADVQATTGTGDTALTYACENGHTDVADVLLQHGAVLEHESEGGRTPLMKAARAGHRCTVQFLISKGADVNRQTTTNDHTVLSLACAGGHLSVVEKLLEHGADPTHKLKDGSTMVIEAAKGGHTQVVQLLLEYPNRMLMNSAQELPALSASDPHLVESRVPIHGLANIVPPSEPDSHPSKPNNLTTTACEHSEGSACRRKAQDKDMNIPIKAGDQIWQNMQKLAKKSASTGNAHCLDLANKINKTSNLTIGDVPLPLNENGLSTDLLPDETIDLKAGERLEQIISNVMAKELISTASTREEQILRKQQILEELQKVERELQEKAQQQLLITAQHQQQQHQQLQQALQSSRQKVLQKQLEDQKKRLPVSSPAVSSSTHEGEEAQVPNNLDKQASKLAPAREASGIGVKSSIKPNISESGESNGTNKVPEEPVDGSVSDQSVAVDKASNINGSGKTSTANSLANGQPSSNGGVQSHNGGSQSSPVPVPSQAARHMPLPLSQQSSLLPNSFPPQSIPLPVLPTSLPTSTSPAPPKPPQLIPSQQQQLEQQLLQLQHQQQQQQQQQQQTVINPPPFVLNESQRVTLQNLILRQQQEAQQLAQQTSLQFPQLQLTPQQQDHLLQVLSQQHTFTTQQLQQAHQAIKQQQQQQFVVTSQQQQQQQQTQQQNLLQHTAAMNPNFSPGLFNPQQQQQLLQQQQQAQLFQQQLQHIQPPASTLPVQKPGTQRKTKALLPTPQVNSPEAGLLGIDTVTPPPSTPLTPNPSPASPESISPLYAAIDLDAQTESNHDTALTLACAGGHSELVTLLLSKGADIEHRDKKGFTPLILAATAGHVDVVGILLEHGADIEAQSERTKDTPLSLACSGGRYEVVELLLARTANKEHRNVSDYTPLSLAASGGFVTIIKLLLSHGAEINSRTGSKLGISPLMLAAMNGHTAAVKLLLDMGSDINAQIETNRNTALTLACFQGRHEVVSLLVDRRANIEHRAKTGLTPLMEAASGGYVEVGRVLLDKGADVNAPPVPSSRDTALTIAADKGHYRFVELLLSRHAAVDVKNKKGNSPLWLACHGGHLDVVQLLVTAGADIDSQDNRKVSCLMAAFRKGHIKVVKWMVKHVSQFPSDTELTRYIATITDKDVQRKCQQCKEIIVLAKDRQAAEANRNASDLLEELDKERQHEEHKKAAAAKKREKKKKKKKEKQVTREKEPSTDSKNTTPEPESEDSQPQEKEEKKEEKLVLQAPTATTTSTLGINLPSSEPIYTKAKGRSNKRMNKEESPLEIMTLDTPLQDENKDPKNNRADSSSLSRTESKKNKRNRRDVSKEQDRVPSIEMTGTVEPEKANVQPASQTTGKSSRLDKESRSKSKASSKKKKAEKEAQLNSTTAISDLDDFGNLPSISDRDIEKLRKTVEKTKISNVEKSHYEKHGNENTSHTMLTVKSAPAVVNSPKRGQKKEDGWKEVIRKSKKVQVPASAISRVIGRGGCNINAIREVSGANIDVEKNKGSGDRFITIKGSADATRQAHALITALVTDPDKELIEILPKTKTKQPVENKSLYFIPPNESINQPITGGGCPTSKGPSNKSLAPRLQQQAALSASNVSRSSASVPQNMPNPSMVWGSSPTPGSMSPRRNSGKGSGIAAPYPVPLPGMTNGPTVPDKGSVTRQLFLADKRVGFTSPSAVTQTAISGMMMAPKSIPAPTDIRPQHPIRPSSSKILVPGTVKLLQRPSSTGPAKPEQMSPLPILNQVVTTSTTLTISSSINSLSMSSSGEFSPFDNIFSNNANQFLGKKEDVNERMNFASAAAAGVVPTFSNSSGMSPVPNSPDPALQALAPGFKPPTGPRIMGPQEMMTGFPKYPGFPVPPHMMDMNMSGMQLSFQLMQGQQAQSPNASPRSSQSSTAGLSPRSNHSGFEMPPTGSQKMEYATPNQPMTLPKISSSLNPNAPDFAPDFNTRASNSVSGPGGPPNVHGVPINHAYQQALQMLSNMTTMPSQPSGNNPPPGAPPSQSPVPVGSSPDPLAANHQEFYQNMQNMASLMQHVLQNQTPGSPGLGPSPPVPSFASSGVPRPFSPLPVQGRPNSAPSMGVMPKDGPSPTPMGAPKTNSPLPPSTPPMPDMMRPIMEDRRQPRPIGGERQHRKAPGPLLGPGPDFGDSFWPNQLNDSIDWNAGKIPLSSASLQTSVISTSVISGSNMSTSLGAAGDARVLHIDNHHPSSNSSLEDLSDQNFSHYVQSSGLPPLFNGVGATYPGPVFGSSSMVGDSGLQAMWSNSEPPASDDLQDPGVSDKQKMWNWSK